MATPVVDPQPQMSSKADDDFYTGQNLNTLQHAKSLRNSVIFRDPSANSINSIQSNTNAYSVEQKTGLIKMTSSPSLSALAGILNEKTKQADIMVRKLSANLASEAIKEESEELTESRQQQSLPKLDEFGSPNLIDLADNDEAVIFQHPIPLKPSIEQPDFLSTPQVQQSTKENSFEPNSSDPSFISSKSQSDSVYKAHDFGSQNSLPTYKSGSEYFQEDVQSYLVEHHAKQEQPSTPSISTTQEVPSLDIQKGTPVLQRPDSDEKVEKKTGNIKSKRRRSLLNFWKKPKEHLDKQISNSKSFSLASNRIEAPEDVKGVTNPATKRSLSSNSIFTSFRKNKNNNSSSGNTREESVVEPKTESKILPKNSNNARRSSQKRKPTPLNFEKDLPAVKVEEKFPIDVFPKSLNVTEVESIVSLERSRSVKSNQRNSISSLRTRSLSDHISLNAKMEGMFITEATTTSLAAPDLSKSPVSSILRNGKFEPTTEEKLSKGSDFDNSTESSNLTISHQQRDSSFGSIEQKLNELTMESDNEEPTVEHLKLQTTTISPTGNSDNEDNELISDIMEFASIIDFGQDIELNFDLQSEKQRSYETLNPVRTASRNSLSKPSFNGETVASIIDEPTDSAKVEMNTHVADKEHTNSNKHEGTTTLEKTLEATPDNVSSSDFNTFSENSFNFNNYEEEEDFENEDFNNIHAGKDSPTISAFLPDMSTSMSRPISMSFRGLKAPQFNSSIELSGLVDYDLTSDRNSTKLAERSQRGIKLVNFSSQIVLYETYGEIEYDRHPDSATCNQLTPQLAQLIKEELNELKAEMEIHEESKCNTHFF